MTPERYAACKRIIEERFQAGEYDFVGRDLLAALDEARASIPPAIVAALYPGQPDARPSVEDVCAEIEGLRHGHDEHTRMLCDAHAAAIERERANTAEAEARAVAHAALRLAGLSESDAETYADDAILNRIRGGR